VLQLQTMIDRPAGALSDWQLAPGSFDDSYTVLLHVSYIQRDRQREK